MKHEYFWVLALVCAATSFIGILVLCLNQGFKKKTNITFSLFTFSISAWALGICLMFLASSSKAATFYCALSQNPVPFIPVFYFHYLYFQTQTIIPKWFFALYLYPLGSIIANLGGWLVSGAIPKYGFELMIQAGPAYPWFILGFMVVVIWATVFLIKALRNSSGLKIFCSSSLVGFL